MALNGNTEEATMSYIIRDHNRENFEARKALITGRDPRKIEPSI